MQFSTTESAGKAELSGRSRDAETAVCEGLLLPEASTGILVLLPSASWRNTRSVSLQAPGPEWFLKCKEATSASTSPVPIHCACVSRVASGQPLRGGENGKNTGGRLGGDKESSNSNSSTSIQTCSSCNPSRSDCRSASSSKSSCKSIS